MLVLDLRFGVDVLGQGFYVRVLGLGFGLRWVSDFGPGFGVLCLRRRFRAGGDNFRVGF